MKAQKSVLLVLLSDTHELHREVDITPADIMLFAGDLTMASRSRAAIQDFNDWLGEIPCRFKVVVPGNHDTFLEDPSGRKLLSNATAVLVNDGIELLGLKIWGSPITTLSSGAFCMPSSSDRARLFSNIPKGTDILVTHIPPLEILDHAPGQPNTGCPELLMEVLRVKPRMHVFGHVHAAYGITHIDTTTYINASLLGADGDIEHPPIVMKINRES